MLVNNEKVIVKNKIYAVNIEMIWSRWTTSEGLKTFMGFDNNIDFKIGGEYEIYFLKENPIGLRGGEGCKVLSYIPKSMLSFTWSVPPEYLEIRSSLHKTWIVLFFNEVSENKVELTLHHLGWPKNEKWDRVYDYFSTAWDTVLGRLKDSLTE